MSPHHRSLMIYAVLALATHALAFQAGRMTVAHPGFPVVTTPAPDTASPGMPAQVANQAADPNTGASLAIANNAPPAVPTTPKVTLPAASAPPVAELPPLVPPPGIAVVPASATAVAKIAPPVPAHDPHALLQSKGLIRSGLVYVLPEEDSIDKKYNELSRVFADWQAMLREMNDGMVDLARLQDKLIALERRDKPSNPSITVVYVDAATPGTESKRVEAAPGAKEKDSKADAKSKQNKKDGSTSAEENDTEDPTGSRSQSQPPFPYTGRNGYPNYFDNRLHGGPFPGTGGYGQSPGGMGMPSGVNGRFPSQTGATPSPGPYGQTGPIVPGSPVNTPQTGRDINIPGGSSPPQGTTPSTIKPHGPVNLKIILPQMFQIAAIPPTREGIHGQLARTQYHLNELEYQASIKGEGLQRRHASLSLAVAELLRRYEALAKDPEVDSALNELNKTANPKFTLGPRHRYEANLREMTEKQLKDEGLRRDQEKKVFTVAFVATLAHNARLAEGKLREALAKLEVESKKSQTQWESLKKRATKAIQEGKADSLANVQKEMGFADANEDFKKLKNEVMIRRDTYVQSVAALHKALEEEPRKRDEWKKSHPDIKIEPISASIRNTLQKAESTIKTAEISLVPDKTMNWLEVRVEGKTEEMVVDPTVKFLRMSEATAARLGLKGVGEGIPAEVVMEDGQKLPARRVTFKEVQVGDFSAKDVEGLIILKGSEARPVLAASFLERFAFRFDPDAAKLVLTRVELPPSTRTNLLGGLDKKASASTKKTR